MLVILYLSMMSELHNDVLIILTNIFGSKMCGNYEHFIHNSNWTKG